MKIMIDLNVILDVVTNRPKGVLGSARACTIAGGGARAHAVVSAAAESSSCDYIVTRNLGDFKGSPVAAISPEDFCRLFWPNANGVRSHLIVYTERARFSWRAGTGRRAASDAGRGPRASRHRPRGQSPRRQDAPPHDASPRSPPDDGCA